MSVLDALKGVLKVALIHDGLARGLREASKALDRRQAHMCVLNEACEEEAYKKLVVALCEEHKIPLIKVPDGKQLGEWAGLCEWSFFFKSPFVRSSDWFSILYMHELGSFVRRLVRFLFWLGMAFRFLYLARSLTYNPSPHQVSSTAKATPAKSSTVPVSSSATGARNPKSAPSS